MMTSFSVSNAMNDFDPVGAMLPAKCSALSPRSALVGLNFLNYDDLLPHDAPPYPHGRQFTDSTFLFTLSDKRHRRHFSELVCASFS